MSRWDPGKRAGVYIDTSGDEPVLHDWRGSEVRVGDRVFYPMMSGRSTFMAEGVVESIEPVAARVKEHKESLAHSRKSLAAAQEELQYTEDQLPERVWAGAEPWTLDVWRARAQRSIEFETKRIAELEQPQDFEMKVVIKVVRDNLHDVPFRHNRMGRSSKRAKDTVSLTRYDNVTKFP